MRWIKTSYFWIIIALLIASVVGAVSGAEKINDPGQPLDNWLPLWYLIAAVVMFINMVLSLKAIQKAEVEKAAVADKNRKDKKEIQAEE